MLPRMRSKSMIRLGGKKIFTSIIRYQHRARSLNHSASDSSHPHRSRNHLSLPKVFLGRLYFIHPSFQSVFYFFSTHGVSIMCSTSGLLPWLQSCVRLFRLLSLLDSDNNIGAHPSMKVKRQGRLNCFPPPTKSQGKRHR